MNDADFQHLLDAEPPVRLMPNKATAIVALIICTPLLSSLYIFFLPMLLKTSKSTPDMVVSLVVVGFLTIIFGWLITTYARILCNPNRWSLLLERDSFTIKAIGGRKTRYWKDVSEFRIRVISMRYGTVNKVCYDCPPQYNCILPDPDRVFDITPNQLAQLMNHWRERALK